MVIKDKLKSTKEEIINDLLGHFKNYTVAASQIYQGLTSAQTPYEKLIAIQREKDRFCGAAEVLDKVLGIEVRTDSGMLFTNELYNQFFYWEQTLEMEITSKIDDPLHKEIGKACENIGVKGYIGYEPLSYKKVRVNCYGSIIGVYDLHMHAFVE